MDTNRSGLSFKAEFGLHSFGSSETDLMYDRKFPASGVAEDGSATKFLSGEVIPSSRELAPEKRGFILVGEDQIPGFQLIHFQNPAGTLYESRSILGCAFLLAKLASGAFRSVYGSGPHFDAKLSKDPAATERATGCAATQDVPTWYATRRDAAGVT
jgi:hypothetical protein